MGYAIDSAEDLALHHFYRVMAWLGEELGLDHFEGRSWTGLHRHALMTMMAYAFLQSRRLAQAGRKKKSPRSASPTHPASSAPSHP